MPLPRTLALGCIVTLLAACAPAGARPAPVRRPRPASPP